MRDVITIKVDIVGERIEAELHRDPHWEELAALEAAVEFGDKAFLAKYCSDGKLRLGTGGGPFDEHSNRETGEGRKKGCCMTLVAEALDLFKKAPWWRHMILFCHFRDTGKQMVSDRKESVEAAHEYDAYSQLRLQFRWRRHLAGSNGREGEFTDERQIEVIDHYRGLIRMFVWEQELFHQAVGVMKESGLRETIPGPDGEQLKLVAMQIPENQKHNWLFNKAARGWLKADVFVQQDVDGNIHVFTNNRAGLKLDDLAQAVNLVEQEEADDVVESNWATLREEGIPYEGGIWYYSRLHGQFHNGTEHYPQPPTRLSLETVVDLVKMTLDTRLFDVKKADGCRKGVCRRNGCGLYKYGLRRCRTIRYHMLKRA